MPEVMGILNTTPDSFSDGGEFLDPAKALQQAESLLAAGATIIDVGGESTRPGARPVPPEAEQQRVLPVITALAREGARVSIDTLHAATARAAIACGAQFINDVSGGLHDPEMYAVAAESGADVRLILGHWRGIPAADSSRSHYFDVVAQVRQALAAAALRARGAGVAATQIIVDPGLGFDKTAQQSWELLRRLPELQALGYPLLIGASRKRMLADALLAAHPAGVELRDRDLATAMVSGFAARTGAWGVRVHEVRSTVSALAVAAAWSAGAAPLPALDPAPDPALAAAAPAASAAPAVSAASAAPAAPPAKNADHITLTGIEVFAHHGVLESERLAGQRFIVDLTLTLDLEPAAAHDLLDSTVNYAELASAIKAAVAHEPVDLIETLAARVARVTLSFAAVDAVKVTIHKPDAPIPVDFQDVSVTLTRKRETL